MVKQRFVERQKRRLNVNFIKRAVAIFLACFIIMCFCRLINAHCFATDFMFREIIMRLFLAINIININCRECGGREKKRGRRERERVKMLY